MKQKCLVLTVILYVLLGLCCVSAEDTGLINTLPFYTYPSNDTLPINDLYLPQVKAVLLKRGVMQTEEANFENPFIWWNSMRLNYNKSLIISGMLSFISYVLLVWTFPDELPNAEITIFTIMFQAGGFFLMVLFANLCFFAGPISEQLIHPSNICLYRKRLYATGKWFSITLIFLIPILTCFSICFHTAT